MIASGSLLIGDVRSVLQTLPDNLVQTVITSPPYYGLRDYGTSGQIGLEGSVSEYVESLVDVFREVRRVLRDDGTLWLNLGDSYAGSNALTTNAKALKGKQGTSHGTIGAIENCKRDKPAKNLLGVPWRVAFALQDDGWILRSDIIWHKPNPMPESVRDRPTKAHEYLFLLAKSSRYLYNQEVIAEDSVTYQRTGKVWGRTKPVGMRWDYAKQQELGSSAVGNTETRNRRTVWTVATQPYKGAHFATYPPKLVEPCVLAGSNVSDIVLDPFSGSGTTGLVAMQNGRNYIGIDLNAEYVTLAMERLNGFEMNVETIEWEECLSRVNSVE